MNYSEVKQLFDLFESNREKVEKAINSIAEDYVTLDDFVHGDYINDNNYYYSSENYVITHSGDVIHIDDSFWCEGNEEYYHSNEMRKAYEYRIENWYSEDYLSNNCDYTYYDGEYYDSDALDYHDLVHVEDVGEIWRRDEAYYHEEEGNYYSYPDNSEEYIRTYHNGSYRSLSFDGKSKYKIGFEIEKEDQDVLESVYIDEFEDCTENLWRKEEDGSLNRDKGYELISPTFEFNIDKIFEYIESNDVLVQHINAEYSTRCGGHINLSEEGLTGEQLFDKIKGYTPLFYSLYYGRVDKDYCKGKNNNDLKNENQKYQAIKIHDNRIEFRIISAVPNVETLKWRSKLLMMILQNPTDNIIKAYYNVDTKFTKLLKQTYSDDKLVQLKERFIKFTRQFEGLDINN